MSFEKKKIEWLFRGSVSLKVELKPNFLKNNVRILEAATKKTFKQ